MKQFQNVIGSQPTVPSLEVNVDTVYVRTNIRPYVDENFDGWVYDEVQYTLREFHENVALQTAQQEEYLVELDFKLALIEMGLL